MDTSTPPNQYIQPWLRTKAKPKRVLEGPSKNETIEKAIDQIEGKYPCSATIQANPTFLEDFYPTSNQCLAFKNSHSNPNSSRNQNVRTSKDPARIQNLHILSTQNSTVQDNFFKNTAKNTHISNAILNFNKEPNQISGSPGPISGKLTTRIMTRTSMGRGIGGK